MIIAYPAKHPEVHKLRAKIYEEDLELPASMLEEYNSETPPSDNKFAYWFSDEKFLNNDFDQILVYYHNGESVGLCGGTHFNANLYRGVQMYYILKRARFIGGLNTLHFRECGFFDWQILRARELGTQAIFISVDMFDQKHVNMYNAMKENRVGFGHMPNSSRKFTRNDLKYPDEEYIIKYTPQRICYYELAEEVNFNSLFYI